MFGCKRKPVKDYFEYLRNTGLTLDREGWWSLESQASLVYRAAVSGQSFNDWWASAFAVGGFQHFGIKLPSFHKMFPQTPPVQNNPSLFKKPQTPPGAERLDLGRIIPDDLTRAQTRNVNKINNVINNNLTEMDFSGTLRDLQGIPVPKPGGGFWDHKTEMVQSYRALKGAVRGLEGSLNNPGLSPQARKYILFEMSRANFYIQKIERLFQPFGGVE